MFSFYLKGQWWLEPQNCYVSDRDSLLHRWKRNNTLFAHYFQGIRETAGLNVDSCSTLATANLILTMGDTIPFRNYWKLGYFIPVLSLI